ncbi:MAG: 2-hydroxyacyl-CoA dehydratase family protein [Thermodesulfobacteriota bacterium]
MTISETFSEAVSLPNRWINASKNQGKKVLGYFCSYIPEEIMTAGGFQPLRMRAWGCTDTPMGDAYMSSTTCSFTRCVLELASEEKYDFLDGLIAYNSCDQIRRLYDNIRFKAPFPYQYFISVPCTQTAVTLDWFNHELVKFKEDLEKHFLVSIEEKNLKEAIRLQNETRSLFERLYDLRKKEAPPVSGSEVLKIFLASVSMPVQEFNPLLKKQLEDLEKSEGLSGFRARIMLIGSHLDEPEFIDIIEEQGGLVVTDSLCFGNRFFRNQVDENTEPLSALAERYLNKISCPRMSGGQADRTRFIMDQIKEFKVDGVVIERMKFCPIWWGEAYIIRDELKKEGIPCLELEREYVLSGAGAIKTRVQAFMETLEGR